MGGNGTIIASSGPQEQEVKLSYFLQWLQVCSSPRSFSLSLALSLVNDLVLQLDDRLTEESCEAVVSVTADPRRASAYTPPLAIMVMVIISSSHLGFKRTCVGILIWNELAGIVMVVPLDLAITPMRVLQDQFVGPRCRALFEEGDVDDRFLVMVFLVVERLRPNSVWKPWALNLSLKNQHF